MSTQHDLLTEPVSSLPQCDLVTLTPETTVGDAMRTIAAQPHACAVVVNDAGKLIGTFTERQIIGSLLRDPAITNARVGDHLAPNSHTHTITANASIADAVAMIDDNDLGYLCVVDAAGKPQHLVGQRSIVDYIVDHCPRAVLTSRLGAHPAITEREGA